MLFRLPERIRPFHYVGFTLILALFELMQGSDPVCVVEVAAYILVASFAFNAVGGLQRPSGGYIFFYSVLTMIFGVVWKAVLWEPVESNLLSPRLFFSVYLVGITAVSVAAMAAAKLRRKTPILTLQVPAGEESRAALGCMIAGFSSVVLTQILPGMGLGVLSGILAQINFFIPLAVLLAVYYRVKETGGRTSFSWIGFIAFFTTFAFGVNSFSKQGIFQPIFCWLLGAAAAGYRTTLKFAAIVVVGLIATWSIFVPYSQYGRNHRDEFANPFEVMVQLVLHPNEIREKNREASERDEQNFKYRYYSEPQGQLERLSMITLDDPLIELSSRGHYAGTQVIYSYLQNNIPAFLLPNKPRLHQGTLYAHELGLLPAGDETTGVSFSETAEAFHIGGWMILLTALPLIVFGGMWVCDSMVGPVRDAPWALLYILALSHAAPEAGIAGPMYVAAQGTVGIIAGILFTTKLAPVIGALLLGPAKRKEMRILQQVESMPQRLRQA